MSNQKTVADAAREGFYGKDQNSKLKQDMQRAKQAFNEWWQDTDASDLEGNRESLRRAFMDGFFMNTGG